MQNNALSNAGTVFPDRLDRLRLGADLFEQRVKEWARFDATGLRGLAGLAGVAAAGALWLAGRKQPAFKLASALHRGACFPGMDHLVQRGICGLRARDPGWFEAQARATDESPGAGMFVENPSRLLGTRVLVLKSPGAGEKGLIAVDYSFTFPLFACLFDVREIAERYYLALEPSWSGYCDLDILCYLGYGFPVFVQASEPRDAAFLQGIGGNLIAVPTGANWWVDHRIFRPIPGLAKDADLVVVSGWSRFKRHAALFAALARLRARGDRLKVILAGYHGDLGRDGIFNLGRYYGVADQLELHEHVSQEEVNRLYNRSRANLIWSRREGVNRAIVEGFFAGTPGILRDGFNYGYHYPFINPATGCFSGEKELPEVLLHVVKHSGEYAPREWAMAHMSCQKALAVLDTAVGDYARSVGEPWSGGLAGKTSHLNAMAYWDEADWDRFATDYDFLRSALRS